MQGICYPWDTPPASGEAIEVAENVLWMRLPLPMALDHVNVYALADADGWTLIDTGFASKVTKKIWQSLLDGPLAGKPVRRVLATHHHPDHIGLAGWFQADHGAELLTSRTAWLFARMLTLDEQASLPSETQTFYTRVGMDPDVLATRMDERPFNFADCVAPLPLGFVRVQAGQTLHLGGRTWDVHVGHGHAPEHLTLWSQDDPLVIGGDQLLPSISPNIGVYPTEPDADPLGDWLASCRAFQPLARDEHLVLGGHKLPFRGLPLRLVQLIENHVSALDRLTRHLSEPRRGGEIFAPLFKREIQGSAYGLALVEAVAHLNHLHQTGRANRWLADDGAWRWQATPA